MGLGCRAKHEPCFLFGGAGDDEQTKWCDGGIGDLHADLKSMFVGHDILGASQDFFEKKISSVEEAGRFCDALDGTMASL